MNPMVSQVFDNYQGYGGMTLFLGCIYMSIQAYADFSAYMDIVSGFSRILESVWRRTSTDRSFQNLWQSIGEDGI